MFNTPYTHTLEDLLISNKLSLSEAEKKGAVTAFFYSEPKNQPVIMRLVDEEQVDSEVLKKALEYLNLEQRLEVAKDQRWMGKPILHHLIICYEGNDYIKAILDSFPALGKLELVQQTTRSNQYSVLHLSLGRKKYDEYFEMFSSLDEKDRKAALIQFDGYKTVLYQACSESSDVGFRTIKLIPQEELIGCLFHTIKEQKSILALAEEKTQKGDSSLLSNILGLLSNYQFKILLERLFNREFTLENTSLIEMENPTVVNNPNSLGNSRIERLKQERLEQKRIQQELLETQRLEQKRIQQELLETQRLAEEREQYRKARFQQKNLEKEPVRNQSTQQASLEKEPPKDQSVEQAPLEKEPPKDQSVEQAPLEKEPPKDQSVEQAPLEKEPPKDQSVEQAPLEKEPPKDQSVEQASLEKEPPKDQSVEQASLEKEPPKDQSVEQAPVKKEPLQPSMEKPFKENVQQSKSTSIADLIGHPLSITVRSEGSPKNSSVPSSEIPHCVRDDLCGGADLLLADSQEPLQILPKDLQNSNLPHIKLAAIERELPLSKDSKDSLLLEKNQLLRREFIIAYKKQCQEDSLGFLGFFRRSRINPYSACLKTIVEHATLNKGQRTFKVLQQLKWIDKEGKLLNPFKDTYELSLKASSECKGVEQISDPHRHFKDLIELNPSEDSSPKATFC